MFELLAAYLEASVSPEQKSIYLNACQALVDHGITDHVFIVEQEMAMADLHDSDIVLASVTGALLPIYREALGEFSIVLSPEITLAQATDIFVAVQLIENYEDAETINGLCDAPEGEVAALSDILELLGAYKADEYLTMIDGVGTDLLRRIAALTTAESPELLPSEAAADRARQRLLKLFAISYPPEEFVKKLLVEKWLEDGGRLGLPINGLIAPYRHDLEQLVPGATLRFATEILGFLLASDLPDAELKEASKHELDQLNADISILMAVDVELNKLLGQVIHA